MLELQIRGTQEFMGKEIPVIEGGFGEGQKVVLAKTIAEIHEVKTDKINDLINNNIDEFEFDIDILDLSVDVENVHSVKDLLLSAGYTNRGITATLNQNGNFYLLSEQGYHALVSIMKTEKAKAIRKQLRREYFAMREIINSDEQLKAQLLLEIYNGGQSGVLASKQLTELEKKPLLDKIEEDKPLVDFAETISKTSDSISIGDFAKLIKDEGIKLGRNKLFEWLRDNKYLMKDNKPYQKYIDNGYFEIIEYSYNTPYGSKFGIKTLITGIGQIKIIEKLRNKNN